jgi:hypothetical protein
VIGDLREQKFITKTIWMISAAEEYKQTLNLGISRNDDVVSNRKVGDNGAVKLSTVTIDSGVERVENLHMKNCSLRQHVEWVSVRGTKTGLQMKGENGSSSNAQGFDGGTRNLS